MRWDDIRVGRVTTAGTTAAAAARCFEGCSKNILKKQVTINILDGDGRIK